jgi:hypothetical protein
LQVGWERQAQTKAKRNNGVLIGFLYYETKALKRNGLTLLFIIIELEVRVKRREELLIL